jgi:hypothetical protein
VALVLYGKLENLAEVRELYDLLPPGEDPLDFSATSESAELLMGTYLRVSVHSPYSSILGCYFCAF